jgi:hypothetical protein
MWPFPFQILTKPTLRFSLLIPCEALSYDDPNNLFARRFLSVFKRIRKGFTARLKANFTGIKATLPTNLPPLPLLYLQAFTFATTFPPFTIPLTVFLTTNFPPLATP